MKQLFIAILGLLSLATVHAENAVLRAELDAERKEAAVKIRIRSRVA